MLLFFMFIYIFYLLVETRLKTVNFLPARRMNLSQLHKFREEHPGLLSIFTFNVRLDTPKTHDGKDAWELRKQDFVEYIMQLKADVFGFQEPQYHQVQYVTEHLKQYSWFGVGSDDGQLTGEMIPLFFNVNTLKMVNDGVFWLSKTPDVPGSRIKGTNLPRVCTWGHFQLKSNSGPDSGKSEGEYGTEFYVLNTHLDYQHEWSQILQLKVILDFIKDIIPKEIPIVLMGDFNFEEKSEPYSILSKSHQLYDSNKNATSVFSAPTFMGFDLKYNEVIDYIWSRGIKAMLHAVMTDTRPNKRQYSDHRAVLCEFPLKGL